MIYTNKKELIEILKSRVNTCEEMAYEAEMAKENDKAKALRNEAKDIWKAYEILNNYMEEN